MVEDPYPEPQTAVIDRLRVAVTAIIPDAEGRILLQQRSDNGYWGLPGGGVEPGESVITALQREVWEETGYTVEVERLVGVLPNDSTYSDPANYQVVRYPDGNVIHYVTCAFQCRLTGGQPTLCNETLALVWHHPDDLPEPFVPSHRIRLRDGHERREAAFVR